MFCLFVGKLQRIFIFSINLFSCLIIILALINIKLNKSMA